MCNKIAEFLQKKDIYENYVSQNKYFWKYIHNLKIY